jgi:hypothetical protein
MGGLIKLPLTLCIAEGGEIELPPLGSKLDEVK